MVVKTLPCSPTLADEALPTNFLRVCSAVIAKGVVLKFRAFFALETQIDNSARWDDFRLHLFIVVPSGARFPLSHDLSVTLDYDVARCVSE